MASTALTFPNATMAGRERPAYDALGFGSPSRVGGRNVQTFNVPTFERCEPASNGPEFGLPFWVGGERSNV